MKIREATMNDIPSLVRLMDDLGYPTTIEKMKHRFKKISEQDNYYTLVAELNGTVVGMARLYSGLFYEYDGSYVRLAAFVVDNNYRRKGIGKALIKKVENWASEIGASLVVLNSGNRTERKNAHQFYTNMGYLGNSTGFSKKILEY